VYTLAVRRSFRSFHHLTGGDWGPENERHGHDYVLELRLRSAALDRHGYVADIEAVDKGLDEVLARFREATLNDLPEFAGLNPSIEHFSRILWGLLGRALGLRADGGEFGVHVRLWEGPDAWAAYDGPA
jgi:6-pyruvoyltetrahydropterin/6-carboxytetrahydropterin synthase